MAVRVFVTSAKANEFPQPVTYPEATDFTVTDRHLFLMNGSDAKPSAVYAPGSWYMADRSKGTE